MNKTKMVLLGGAMWAVASLGHTATTVNLCVFDIIGANGDTMGIAKDYALAAKNWGVNINPIVYKNVEPLLADFNSNKCDGIVADNYNTRPYNQFMATVGAVGVISDYDIAQSVLFALSSPKLERHMNYKNWEVVGYIPYGLAYFASKDRTVDSIQKLAGKRIGILQVDPSQRRMAQKVGMQPINMTIDSMAAQFRKGDFDVMPMPLIAYQPFEIGKVLGSKGGFPRYPLAFLTLNVVMKKGTYPDGFAQKSRVWFSQKSKQFISIVKKWDATVPKSMMYEIPDIDRPSYDTLLAQMRREFVANKTYDSTMINLIKYFRCKQDPKFIDCKK